MVTFPVRPTKESSLPEKQGYKERRLLQTLSCSIVPEPALPLQGLPHEMSAQNRSPARFDPVVDGIVLAIPGGVSLACLATRKIGYR